MPADEPEHGTVVLADVDAARLLERLDDDDAPPAEMRELFDGVSPWPT